MVKKKKKLNYFNDPNLVVGTSLDAIRRNVGASNVVDTTSNDINVSVQGGVILQKVLGSSRPIPKGVRG